MNRMTRMTVIVALLLASVRPVGAEDAGQGKENRFRDKERPTLTGRKLTENLVPNGDFAKGLEGWQVQFLEPNETKYAHNHEWVSVVDAPKASGKAIKFEFGAGPASSEGVKAITGLIPIDPAGSYEFGADLLSTGSTMKIFLEGYKVSPEHQDQGSDQFAGYVRCYRKVIHVKSGVGAWATERQVADIGTLKPRYQPTFVVIKLYAYWPAGTVHYRNVFLRQLQTAPTAPAAASAKTPTAPGAAPR